MQKRSPTMPPLIPYIGLAVGVAVMIGCYWIAFGDIRAGQYIIESHHRRQFREVVKAAEHPWDFWTMMMFLFVFPLVWMTPWVVSIVAGRRSAKDAGKLGEGSHG
jgi:hypothetical protein